MSAQVKTITGDQLLDVYLDGFTTGAASVLATLAGATIPEDVRDRFAQRMAAGVHEDPVALATVRAEIQERLAGRDTGPKAAVVTLPTLPGD